MLLSHQKESELSMQVDSMQSQCTDVNSKLRPVKMCFPWCLHTKRKANFHITLYYEQKWIKL